MRIQKKQIEEAILGISQQTPSSEEVNNTTSAINNMDDALRKAGETARENPMPFITMVDENNFDPNYGGNEYMEYMAWKNNEVRDAFHEWLVTTPEGQAYARELENQTNHQEVDPTDDLPFGESVKNNRKVLKTIKVKNLK